MKGKILTGVGVSILMGGFANATVYVVPPDIDQYKQKTDEAYLDLYKNPQSPIRRGITKDDLDKLGSLATPNAIIKEGADIKKTADAVVQGKTVADGTELSLNIGGTSVRLKAENGAWRIEDCSGNSCTWLGTWLKIEEPLGDWKCTSNGKYGCTKQVKPIKDVFVNTFTGEVKVVEQTKERFYSCGKYGCSLSGEDTKTDYYNEGAIDLQRAITDGVVNIDVPELRVYANPYLTEQDMNIDTQGGKYGG
jgi:hypothetical protein